MEVKARLSAGPGDGILHLTAPVVYARVDGIADRVTVLEVREQAGTIQLSTTDDAAVPGGFPYYRHWKSQRPVQYPA